MSLKLKAPGGPRVVTVALLADAKRLPAEFLAELGVSDLPGGGVAIPYWDEAGAELLFTRQRDVPGGPRFCQPAGVKLAPYGLWKLADRLSETRLLLTEGESDAWTLWHHGLRALGIPGAHAVRCLTAEHLVGVERLIICQDRDESGRKFVEGLSRHLGEIGYQGSAHAVEMPPGFKDVCDVYAGDPPGFLSRWAQLVEQARPVYVAKKKPERNGHSPDLLDSLDASQEWPEPLPLGEPPPPPPFPLGVLPLPLRRLVEEAAAALPCPPDYIAVPMLVLAGGALGAARALAIKEGHVQRAVLYAAVAGPPGSAKSPALDIVLQPVQDREEQLHADWHAAMATYAREMEAYEQARKQAAKNCEEVAEPPEKPTLPRLTVNDATIEAMAQILLENPRGVVMVRDELIGWVAAMNQYREGGKGADQQFWLSCWSGATATIDRKKDQARGPLRVPHPFVAVVGGLTPAKLPALRGDGPKKKADEDGFLDRILVAFPNPTPAAPETWREIPAAVLQDYRDLMDRLRTLLAVPVQCGGEITGWRPYLVKLTSDGRAAWEDFTCQHAAELNSPDFPDHLRGPWAKLRGYCGRLALIVHFLRWASGEFDDDKANVDGESLRRAVLLVDYFKGHARRVHAAMDADKRLAAARKVWEWILKNNREQFKAWEACKDLHSDSLLPDVESLEAPLELLAARNLIREHAPPQRSGPGRKPAGVWLVNPLAVDRENRVNRENPFAEGL